jgi:benzoate-CoA ligase
VAAGLVALGVRPEERVLLAMADDVELAVGILATMYVGAVAVPSSTMLTGPELRKLVVDSRARALLGSAEFAGSVTVAAAGAPGPAPPRAHRRRRPGRARRRLRHLGRPAHRAAAAGALRHLGRVARAVALHLGHHRHPKGAVHRHADIRSVCETYARHVLRIGPDDVCLSAAKLFFAYGIGNSLFFPLSVGASGRAGAGPAEPGPLRRAHPHPRGDAVLRRPVVLGPADGRRTWAGRRSRRSATAISAGEALPARMYHGVLEQYGFEILDGIGSTEALHIFISNEAGRVVPGSSGFPVPGYAVELRRADGSVIEGPDEPGMLHVSGDSLCTGYWCRTAVNRTVFQGEWMRTGDTYVRGADGSWTCLGRADDVLKVGGIWVSPTEVETRLLEHPAVAEAVVVGVPDTDGLDKPVAYVVPRPGRHVDPDDLIGFCKQELASFKRPRRVVEVAELPKTATGKIQRYRLRAMAAEAPVPTTAADVADAQA